MKAYELASAIQKHGVAPLYLVTGDEDYLRDEAVAVINTAVLGPGTGDGDLAPFNFASVYGDETAAVEILAFAAEAPVFATQRLVLVKAAEKLPAREGEALIPYFKAPCESTSLVFVAPKLDGRLKFVQALKEKAVTVECSPLPDALLSEWIQREAARLGLRLNDDAVLFLKELTGASLYRLKRELEKLAAFVPAGQTAGPAEVERIKGGEPGASVFDLAEAIGRQDRERALRILVRNLEAGEAPLRMLGSLAWQYRRVWRVKDLIQQRRSEAEISRLLGMQPYRVREAVAQTRLFSEAHLRRAFTWIFETDSDLKGGSAGAPERVLESLVLRLCDDVARATGRGSAAPQQPARTGVAKTRSIPNVRSVRPGQPSKRSL